MDNTLAPPLSFVDSPSHDADVDPFKNSELVRRNFLQAAVGLGALAAFGSSGCSGSEVVPKFPAECKAEVNSLSPEEIATIQGASLLPIVRNDAKDRAVLRRRARQAASSSDLVRLEDRLRESLIASEKGVGIAAPQIGISSRAVLVTLGARTKTPVTRFFVNPRIILRSEDISVDYEGCLSVPDLCGLVRRNRSITVEYLGAQDSIQSLEVTGFDARIFQHEIDHLDGVLYVDRVEGGLQPKDRLKELREQLKRDHPELAMTILQSDHSVML